MEKRVEFPNAMRGPDKTCTVRIVEGRARLKGPVGIPELTPRDAAALSTWLGEFAGQRSVEALERDLAECYRLTGADPDGAPDSMLAKFAVEEVKRLREEQEESYDEGVADGEKLAREARSKLRSLTTDQLEALIATLGDST